MDNKSKYLLIVEHDNGSNGEMHCVTYIHKDTLEEIQEEIKEIRKDKLIYKYAVYSLSDAYTSETHDIGIFLEIAKAVFGYFKIEYDILEVWKTEDDNRGIVKFRDLKRHSPNAYDIIDIKLYPNLTGANIDCDYYDKPFYKLELERNPNPDFEFSDMTDAIEKAIHDYKIRYMTKKNFEKSVDSI